MVSALSRLRVGEQRNKEQCTTLGTGLMAAILCEMARPIADFNHYTLNTDRFLVDCTTVFSDSENNALVQHSQGLVLERKVPCFFFIQGFGVRCLLGDYGDKRGGWGEGEKAVEGCKGL